MSVRGVESLAPKYARLAGLPGVSPHTLRHGFGEQVLDAIKDLGLVAPLLGHERLEPTAIYTKPSARDLERAVETPANRLTYDGADRLPTISRATGGKELARFRTLGPQRIAELTRRRAAVTVDLTAYTTRVEQAEREAEDWGEIRLEPDDNQRTIRRRTSIAGKELG